MKTFTTQPLTDILAWAQGQLQEHHTICFEVLNPDCGRGQYAGERVTFKGSEYCYRSYKAWSDLGELLFCRMLTPKIVSECTILLTYEKLDLSDSFHRSDTHEEKYGTMSPFSRIHKNEEPHFLSPYLRALDSSRREMPPFLSMILMI